MPRVLLDEGLRRYARWLAASDRASEAGEPR
jgi:hypothetical protein